MDSKRTAVVIFLIFIPTVFSFASVVDSLGIKREAGGVFVMHQVEEQETLYALSRRYHTSVANIVELNEITGSNLEVGSVLKIPWDLKLTHQVQAGETLYTLSRRYKMPVKDIRSLNNLTSNELKVGMILVIMDGRDQPPVETTGSTKQVHIVGEKETLYSISRLYNLELEQLKSINDLTDNQISIGDTLWLVQPVSGQSTLATVKTELPTDESQSLSGTTADDHEAQQLSDDLTVTPESDPQPEAITVDNSKSRDMVPVKETGIAAVIDGNIDTRKYLALHPTASVGTIMRVRNEMTNLAVFVRVVGKLPSTGANNNVLIRVSPAAQEALGALDGKFRVELSYIPNQ